MHRGSVRLWCARKTVEWGTKRHRKLLLSCTNLIGIDDAAIVVTEIVKNAGENPDFHPDPGAAAVVTNALANVGR